MSAQRTDSNGNVIGKGASGAYTMIGAVRYYGFNTAITANTTLVTNTVDGVAAPAGSIGVTSHATGRGKYFYSDGTKWQYGAVS